MSDTATPGGPTAENPSGHVPRHRREGVPLDGAPDLGLYGAQAEAADLAEFGENPDTEETG